MKNKEIYWNHLDKEVFSPLQADQDHYVVLCHGPSYPFGKKGFEHLHAYKMSEISFRNRNIYTPDANYNRIGLSDYPCDFDQLAWCAAIGFFDNGDTFMPVAKIIPWALKTELDLLREHNDNAIKFNNQSIEKMIKKLRKVANQMEAQIRC